MYDKIYDKCILRTDRQQTHANITGKFAFDRLFNVLGSQFFVFQKDASQVLITFGNQNSVEFRFVRAPSNFFSCVVQSLSIYTRGSLVYYWRFISVSLYVYKSFELEKIKTVKEFQNSFLQFCSLCTYSTNIILVVNINYSQIII